MEGTYFKVRFFSVSLSIPKGRVFLLLADLEADEGSSNQDLVTGSSGSESDSQTLSFSSVSDWTVDSFFRTLSDSSLSDNKSKKSSEFTNGFKRKVTFLLM